MSSILNATTSSGLVTSADNSGSLQLATNNGTTAVTIDTSQNVGIGTSSPAVKLDVNSSAAGGNICAFRSTATNGGYVQFQGSGSTPTTTGYVGAASKLNTGGSVTDFGMTAVTNLVFGTNDGTERMRIDSSGSLLINATSNGYGVTGGIYAPSVYNFTTASAANMFIESGGFFRRSTSSIKYKTNVQDATHGLSDVMKLRPVTYKGINDGETVFGGFIAEEVHDAGLTEFVQYAEDGTPDALAYGQMVSLLTKAIQEQQAMIETLKTELDATKAEVQALKGTL